MDQLMNVIDKVHAAPQRALDCGPGLGRLNQIHGQMYILLWTDLCHVPFYFDRYNHPLLWQALGPICSDKYQHHFFLTDITTLLA